MEFLQPGVEESVGAGASVGNGCESAEWGGAKIE